MFSIRCKTKNKLETKLTTKQVKEVNLPKLRRLQNIKPTESKTNARCKTESKTKV
jgi:hypothetical protein